jgi:hypothetical protein
MNFGEDDLLLAGTTADNRPNHLHTHISPKSSLEILNDVLETLVDLRKHIAFMLGIQQLQTWNVHTRLPANEMCLESGKMLLLSSAVLSRSRINGACANPVPHRIRYTHSRPGI